MGWVLVVDPRTGIEQRVYDKEGYWRERAEVTTCEHVEIETRVWTQKDGSKAVVGQCQRCGDRRGNPVRVASRDGIAPADLELIAAYDAGVRAKLSDIAIRYIDAADKRDTVFWDQYNAYLQTAEWQRRRLLVLGRCGGICEGCRSAPATEVHHTSYDHVFEEFLFELLGLCGDCHRRWHDSRGEATEGASA